jgi:hypothetical protein
MKLSEFNALSKEERKKVKFKDLPGSIKASMFAILGVVLLVIVIVASPGGSSSVAGKPVVENSALDGSVRQVKEYLKANLKDWDSYQGVDWSPVKMIDSTQKMYWVRHKYRAKNSFGGYVLENQLFTLDSTGQVIEVVPYE